MWGGVLAAAFAVMQFLFGPFLGNLSDCYGRRPVLLCSLVVMSVDYLIMAMTGSIWILFLGRVVGGITAATHATALAYVADVSEQDRKSQNFGLIGAAFGIGFIIGPLFGGVLSEFGSRAPFYAACVLAFGNAVFGYFILPETVHRQDTPRPVAGPGQPVGSASPCWKRAGSGTFARRVLPALGCILRLSHRVVLLHAGTVQLGAVHGRHVACRGWHGDRRRSRRTHQGHPAATGRVEDGHRRNVHHVRGVLLLWIRFRGMDGIRPDSSFIIGNALQPGTAGTAVEGHERRCARRTAGCVGSHHRDRNGSSARS